jgi:hypothetical protein
MLWRRVALNMTIILDGFHGFKFFLYISYGIGPLSIRCEEEHSPNMWVLIEMPAFGHTDEGTTHIIGPAE